MRNLALLLGCVVILNCFASLGTSQPPQQAKRLKILFLGDGQKAGHYPESRYKMIEPVLAARGIDLVYTSAVTALNDETLAKYDGLMIYANTTKISPQQEKALLDFVASGKGFIPLHCASYCFQNSTKYIELVGGQFKTHGTGVFRTVPAGVNHPIMNGYESFESWDETYVHTKHNDKDRTILEYRVDSKIKEPYTWVRTYEKGRVFYTAWGHDERTWNNPGFHNLVERGIRWAVGQDLSQVPDFFEVPKMTPKRTDVKPFEYKDAKVAFYDPNKKGGKSTNLDKMQLPLEPDESAKHMVFPEQFELKLFASEPFIKRPICMNWDERGRLWIAETVDYPNERKANPGEGRDRIVILEDTKGTGKADKLTVFADKLSIPASFMFANGGVIIHQVPKTLFLKSSKGDDHADIRVELISGWGTNDTHAGPSNLRYGLDNWYYGIVGYAGIKATIAGESFSRGQTFYRFQANEQKVSKFEFVRGTNNNSWGVGFSEEGLLFGSTANGNPSVYVPIPNHYYEQVRGTMSESKKKGAGNLSISIAGNPKFAPITDKIRQVDFHGRFTAAAGHALYTARLYPRAYWNRTAFVAEPTGHLLAAFQLDRNGTEVASKPAWNLLASDDEWTAPIMAEVGPDGCVWIIDWYNFIVQHNPTPQGFKTGKGAAYETELRDKTHGRIYRLVPKNANLPAPISLKDATPQKLVDTLANDNMFWRLHAQRLLVERGKQDVLPALLQKIADPSVDGIGLNPGAIHALWTLHGLKALGGPNPDPKATLAAENALRHNSAGVRRNAALVLPQSASSTEALLTSGVLNDPDAQVRLAALLALSEMPSTSQAGLAIVELMFKPENYRDRFIVDAAIIAAARHDVFFLKAVASTKQTHNDRTLRIVEVVSEHHARGGKAEAIGDLVLAFAGAEPQAAERFASGFATGWPKGKTANLNEPAEKALAKILTRLTPTGQGKVLQLATTWGVKGLEKEVAAITKTMFATLANEKESDDLRLAAARQLLDMRSGDAETVDLVLAVVTPQASPQLAVGVLELLGSTASSEVAKSVAKRLPTLTPQARSAALRVLLTRPDRTKELLNAMASGQVQLDELTPDQKQSLANHSNSEIAKLATEILGKIGGLADPDRDKVVKELEPLLTKKGDVVMGKAVFTKNCATCHMHGNEGNKVGPDLTGMSVHPKLHLLVDIIDPSRNVEGNFRLYNLTMTNGITLSGMVASETKNQVEVVDAQGKKHLLLREEIDKMVVTNKSLMPDGFEKTLTRDELVNLLEFLTARGQFFAVPLAKAATVVTTQGMFNSKDNDERMIFSDWGPKTFKGVPFQLVDPQGSKVPNAILLYSKQGKMAATMPRSVKVAVNGPAKAIHMLSGVSGWGYPYSQKKDVVLIVRLHYADGKTEDHALKNGEHFSDYISRNDVPGSEFAFSLRSQQIRYLAVQPKRDEAIAEIEFVKGPDTSAPVIMAVTVESR